MRIDIPEHVNIILSRLREAGFEGYLVGGCVRDALLGRDPADYDVCTDALPEQTERCFADFRLIETGLRHGTVTVLSGGQPVEITTFRTDGAYSDNRRPDSVRFVRSLREDLARRDFTVNAMAYSPDSGLCDPFGGEADLRRGVIRCVGCPDERFGEDGLRILRALRFAARYGFSLEAQTAEAVRRRAPLLHNIAPERLFTELKGILTGPGAGAVLRAYPSVFFEFLPELAPELGFDQKNRHHIHDVWTHTTFAVDAIAPEPALRLTMLLHDVGKPARFFTDENGVGHFYGHAETGAELADAILRRLRADNDTRETATLLIRWHDIQPPQTRRAFNRLASKLGVPVLRQLAACWTADAADRSERVRAEDLDLIAVTQALLDAPETQSACLSKTSLAVGGAELLALGMSPGPAVGRVLDALFTSVLDGDLPNERGALLEKAKALLADE